MGFLHRVGVIESDEELASVPLGVVLVEQHGFGVADVQVSRGFRGEAGHHLPLDGLLQGRTRASVIRIECSTA